MAECACASVCVRVCLFANWMNELICYRNEVKADRRPSGRPNPAAAAGQEAGVSLTSTQCSVCAKQRQLCMYFLHRAAVSLCAFYPLSLNSFFLALVLVQKWQNLFMCFSNICSRCVSFRVWTPSHYWLTPPLITDSNEPVIHFSPPEPLWRTWQQTHRRPATRTISGRAAWACNKEGG